MKNINNFFTVVLMVLCSSTTLMAVGTEVAVGTQESKGENFIILTSQDVHEKLLDIFTSRKEVYKEQLHKGMTNILNKILSKDSKHEYTEELKNNFLKKMHELQSGVVAEQFVDLSKKFGILNPIQTITDGLGISEETINLLDLAAEHENSLHQEAQKSWCTPSRFFTQATLYIVKFGVDQLKSVTAKLEDFTKNSLATLIQSVSSPKGEVDEEGVKKMMESFDNGNGIEDMVQEIINLCVSDLVNNYKLMNDRQQILISAKLIDLQSIAKTPALQFRKEFVGEHCSQELQQAIAHLMKPKTAPESEVFVNVKTPRPYISSDEIEKAKRIPILNEELSKIFLQLKNDLAELRDIDLGLVESYCTMLDQNLSIAKERLTSMMGTAQGSNVKSTLEFGNLLDIKLDQELLNYLDDQEKMTHTKLMKNISVLNDEILKKFEHIIEGFKVLMKTNIEGAKDYHKMIDENLTNEQEALEAVLRNGGTHNH